jgi:hypothetical protein
VALGSRPDLGDRVSTALTPAGSVRKPTRAVRGVPGVDRREFGRVFREFKNMIGDTVHISDLVPDPANRRIHNDRNISMVVTSLREVGAARSIVIDEKNEVLAGNGVVEAAKQAGLTKIHVVEADGDTIVAVRRRGLTPQEKRSLV